MTMDNYEFHFEVTPVSPHFPDIEDEPIWNLFPTKGAHRHFESVDVGDFLVLEKSAGGAVVRVGEQQHAVVLDARLAAPVTHVRVTGRKGTPGAGGAALPL
jgi:hypothetical protein